jgi:uncharacterized membrane protein
MIFWILLGIVALLTLLCFVVGWIDDGFWSGVGTAIMMAFFGSLFGALILAVTALISLATPPTSLERTSVQTVQLRAAESGTASGRAYVFRGYDSGKRVLNYTAQQDGYSMLGRTYAADTKIFEDGKKELLIIKTLKHRWWVAPFTWDEKESYEFHVPEGSIVEDFEIK